jgi:cell wall-associated NlpC family hydrolase
MGLFLTICGGFLFNINAPLDLCLTQTKLQLPHKDYRRVSMDLLKEYALKLLGTPYRWGGNDPMEGFVCSGLVIELLQSKGMLPRGYDNTAQGLYNEFKDKSVEDLAKMGTLVFFGKSRKKITHVGFMLDNETMIEAGGGGSRTVSEQAASQHNAFVRLRPIYWRKDLVAMLKPHYD